MRRVILRITICFLVHFAMHGLPGTANAAADHPGIVVIVAEESQREELVATAFAIQRQLADMTIELDVRLVSSLSKDPASQGSVAAEIAMETNALLVLWGDLTGADSIYLYLPDPKGGRILERRISGEQDGRAGRFEALAVIIRAAIEAPPLPPVGPAAQERGADNDPGLSDRSLAAKTRIGPLFGGAYSIGLFSQEQLLAHTTRICVGLRLPPVVSIRGEYAFTPGIEAHNSGTSIRLFVHTARLGLAGEYLVGRLLLGGQLGGIISFFNKRTSLDEANELSVGDESVDVALGPEIRLWIGVVLGSGWRLVTGPSVTYFARNVSYEIDVIGQQEVILRPWAIQSSWSLGVEVAL